MSTIQAIQPGFRGLAPLTAEDPANLPRHLTMLVQLNLKVDSIVALGKTSRRWANLTNDPQLWRYLLTRDFGQECSENVLDKDCKQKYAQMYKATQEFMEKTPRKRALLAASKADQAVKLCGLISYRGFEEYLDSLSDVGFVLDLAAKQGLTPVMKLIMQSPRFNEIAADRGLGYAFFWAATRGQIAAMKLIMQSPRFSEIQANVERGLGGAFILAAENGHIAAMELIMQSPRFNEIPVNDFLGLGYAFILAAENGHIAAMELIMQSPRFNEIPANDFGGLGYAFFRVARAGQIAAIGLIMEDSRFAEINRSTLFAIVRQAPLSMKLHILKNLAANYLMSGWIEAYKSSSLT